METSKEDEEKMRLRKAIGRAVDGMGDEVPLMTQLCKISSAIDIEKKKSKAKRKARTETQGSRKMCLSKKG